MAISDLLRTDIHLATLLGERDEREDFFVVQTPENPGFFYGNLLVLKDEPRAIAPWITTFEEAIGAEKVHRCIAWSGEPLGPKLLAEAEQLGLEVEAATEMFMDVAPPSKGEWVVRPIELEKDWAASVQLSIDADVAEQEGDESFHLFKERLRETRRKWIERGLATWWGAFDGERLVGQCGMVQCEELGRYQAVETHPDWRRRGVCASLISTVAHDALHRLGCERLILVAEVDGPALELYRRLGFTETGQTHSLLRHNMPLKLRDEKKGDHAAVRSLVTAAFENPAEALVIETLRETEDAISIVAELTNSIVGHLLFSRMHIEGEEEARSVCALAPLAVRPSMQGRGYGTKLVREGLELCKQAGYELCFVVGSPKYYERFGFEPATPHGFTNTFDLADEHFMAAELVPGALAKGGGRAVYHEAFDAV